MDRGERLRELVRSLRQRAENAEEVTASADHDVIADELEAILAEPATADKAWIEELQRDLDNAFLNLTGRKDGVSDAINQIEHAREIAANLRGHYPPQGAAKEQHEAGEDSAS